LIDNTGVWVFCTACCSALLELLFKFPDTHQTTCLLIYFLYYVITLMKRCWPFSPSAAQVTTPSLYVIRRLYRRTNVLQIRNWQNTAAWAPGRRYLYTHQVAVLFCVKWCHGRHLEIMTISEIRIHQSMPIYYLIDGISNKLLW